MTATNSTSVPKTERPKLETVVPPEPAIGNNLIISFLSTHYIFVNQVIDAHADDVRILTIFSHFV